MKKKIVVLLVSAIMLFSLGACNTDRGKETIVSPPDPVNKVSSVQIQYNDKVVAGGVLSVDISMATVALKAVVQKTADSVDGTVVFTSSITSVASVTNAGVVTLVSKGETVISAKAGDEKYEIVLVVGNDYATAPDRHRITVVGGTSDITSAIAGDYVTLTAAIPLHKNFVKWSFAVGGTDVTDLWRNGNIFEMPKGDITVTATYEDRLYTLNVVNGTVKGNESGEVNDNITVYKLIYNTEITAVANEEPTGKMFVGWDFKVKNNRVGELGEREYGPFVMPGETLTVWAMFSNKSGLELGACPFGDVNRGYKAIVGGVPTNEEADADLDGMDGYRFAIPVSASAVPAGDYSQENIPGSNITTLNEGSQTVKVIFKNHHATLPVTVEFYATYYNTRITTGHVTIPAGKVVTNHFIAKLGVDKPWMGFVVRESIGGTGADTVLLDVVVQKAATYPEGDKQFEISGSAKWVNLGAYNNDTGWARERMVNNNLGMTMIAVYGGNIADDGYTRASITNMPVFDAQKATTRMYFRVINANANVGNFKFNVGTNLNPGNPAGGSLGAKEFELQGNATETFYIDVARTDNAQAYFSIVKAIRDSSNNLYGHDFVIQMAYNNVFGVTEA